MTILQALDGYYGRMAARGDVVAPGWSIEPVGVLLDLAPDGTLLEVIPWLTDKDKPRPMRVPKWFSRSGTGSTPNFLWDNAAYVLGLGGDKDPGKTSKDHAAFRKLNLDALAAASDPGLVAVRRFIETWTPADGPPTDLTPKLLAFAISFRFAGDAITRRPGVDAIVEQLSTAKTPGPVGFCLVRGERLPLVQLHPKIKGVDGVASAEVPLVSFNASAFESYGKEQGLNAPTSKIAAFRYGAALNELLTRGGTHRLRIADATVAFWADGSDLEAAQAEAAAAIAEEIFGSAIDPPSPDAEDQRILDDDEAMKVHLALAKAAKGRGEVLTAPAILEKVRFYVLGLSPNVARLSVRYWFEGRFEQFADALDAHAEAFRLLPAPWKRAPSAKELLRRTTALQGKFDNIPNGLAGAVLHSILSNSSYPRTWMAAVLLRLHAGDDQPNDIGWRAAALKACINRPVTLEVERLRREGAELRRIIELERELLPVALDADNPSPAYQLGRLFAVVESAQYAALGRINASVKDRYFGAASSTPARVFGTLIRGAENHIADAKKRRRGLWIDPKMTEIIGRLDGGKDIPKSLRIEDQARFAVGYYHERGDRPAKAKEEEKNVDVATEENV